MKTEDIAKLPPELRPAAELWAIARKETPGYICEEAGEIFTARAELRELSYTALPLALTWGLQMQNESEIWKTLAGVCEKRAETAEATIATHAE